MASSVDAPLSVVDWDDPNLCRDFSVGRDGLHLGFDQYAVAQGACGSAKVVIVWDALRSWLTPVGREVLADAA